MIVILTGAGISRESGLDTFRDEDGIWNKVNLDDVATPEGFARNPNYVQAFYNERRAVLRTGGVQPNAAHHALARLEQSPAAKSGFLLVTQNVDNLHEKAGSKALLHMHGELASALCAACGARHPWLDDLDCQTPCPACAKAGFMRPDVVWFGEMPYHMDTIEAAIKRCTLFAAIGTSGEVYPAAGFVRRAHRAGARTVEINPQRTGISRHFDLHVPGRASRAVPAWVDALCADG